MSEKGSAGLAVRPPGPRGNWGVWGLCLLVAALLLGAHWGNDWSVGQLEESIKRSSEAFIATRAFEAVLSELRSVGVSGGAVVMGTVAPFAWLEPLREMAGHTASLLFTAAMVQGVLRLFADVAAHGAFLGAALCMLVLAGWAGYRRWAWAPLLWRLTGVLVCLRLVVPVYALLDCGAQSVVSLKMAEASQAIRQAPVPNVASAASDAVKSQATKLRDAFKSVVGLSASSQATAAQAAPSQSGGEADWLKVVANALVGLAGALAFEVFFLPLLALWFLRVLWHSSWQVVRGLD